MIAWCPAWLNKNWSLTTRLTTLYFFSTSAILLLAMAIAYYLLLDNLRQDSDQLLRDELVTIQTVLNKRSTHLEALQQEIIWAPTVQKHRYYARVLNQEHDTIISTPGMKTVLPASIFPVIFTGRKRASSIMSYETKAEKYYRLISLWTRVGQNKETKVLIQVAVDVTSQHFILKRQRVNLIMIFLLGLLVAVSLGLFVSRRGLRHLHHFTEVMENISGKQLDQRVDEAGLPSEFIMTAQAFNKMLNRIEAAFDRLQQFSGNLAHELRTPINNLMGEAGLALSRERDVPEYKDVLASSMEEYNRLSRMIERLLFLAHAEHPKALIQPVDIQVAEEFAAMVDYYDALAEEKQVTIRGHGDALLIADPLLLRRALSNLVSNALKHTSEGGCIDLSVEVTADQVIIRVRDNGIGIPEEHLPKVFDRFYRVDSSRSKNSGGTGLGLAIVQSIMQLHQGAVEIKSEPGRYTEISLVFPI